MQRDRVPGGQGGPPERLYLLPLGLLQMLPLRHQTDIKDLLQQSTQAGGQRGELSARFNGRRRTRTTDTECIHFTRCRCTAAHTCRRVAQDTLTRRRWEFGRRWMHPRRTSLSMNRFGATEPTWKVSLKEKSTHHTIPSIRNWGAEKEKLLGAPASECTTTQSTDPIKYFYLMTNSTGFLMFVNRIELPCLSSIHIPWLLITIRWWWCYTEEGTEL